MISRALILALALVVSPVGAAICEVVCGSPAVVVAAVIAESAPTGHDAHAQHAHHGAPPAAPVTNAPEKAGDVAFSIPSPECDLRVAVPARLRLTSSEMHTSVAITTSPFDLALVRAVHPRRAGATASPPSPPTLTPLPLRI